MGPTGLRSPLAPRSPVAGHGHGEDTLDPCTCSVLGETRGAATPLDVMSRRMVASGVPGLAHSMPMVAADPGALLDDSLQVNMVEGVELDIDDSHLTCALQRPRRGLP